MRGRPRPQFGRQRKAAGPCARQQEWYREAFLLRLLAKRPGDGAFLLHPPAGGAAEHAAERCGKIPIGDLIDNLKKEFDFYDAARQVQARILSPAHV